jgi:hypothetical protein
LGDELWMFLDCVDWYEVYARRVVRRALSEEAAVEARGMVASNRVEGCILLVSNNCVKTEGLMFV